VDHRWPLKAVAAGMLLVLSGPQAMAAGDLGIIRVESTTIDDKFEQKRDEASSIGVVSGETVDRSHTENIQQLLQSIPGVTTEVQSGDSLKIHIRGVENQVYMGERPGVAIVIDGVPVFERTGRVNIDLDNIESIKVIKGGASYLYGDDALSGAVIITTKRGAQYAGVKLGGEIGSFGYEKKLARVGYADDNWNGHLQITNREVDGYYEDSGSKADYFNGKLQYYVDDASDLTFGFEQSDRAKNSHGAVKGVTNAELDPRSKDPNNEYNDYANHYDVELEKYFVTYSRDFSDTDNLMVNAYQFSDDTKFDSSPADSDPDVYRYGNDYQQVQRGIKAEYRAGGEQFAWMAAADLRDNTYENETTFISCLDLGAWAGCNVGDLSSDNETDEKIKAIYGELKFRVADPLVLTLNGRYDRIEFDYTDDLDPADSGDESFDVFSWRLGLNYAFRDNLDFYANISTGFRTPTVTQLFTGSNSPTHRTAANPNLDEEEAFNYEMGMRANTEWFGLPVDLDVSIFQLDRKDFIQSSAGIYTTSDDAVYENVGDARNRGLELSLVTDQKRKLSMELAYTYLHAKYTKYDEFYLHVEPSGGGCPGGFTAVWEDPPGPAPLQVVDCYQVHDNKDNFIPRTPKHVLNLLAHYRPTPHWLITGEMVTKSSYYADEINYLNIGGHSTFNLLVNYNRKYGPGKWEFFARVDNLTDKEFYNTARSSGDGNDDGVYDAEDLSLVVNQGRTYTAGLAVTF
jgi:iron complex outermembrane receptor protein